MPFWTLRKASSADGQPIRELIRHVQINPLGLDWHRFVVAVDGAGRLVGCGQLKPHGDNILELASLAVVESYRGQGVARALIEDLLEAAPRPLYLTCRGGLGSFYEKWGFRRVVTDEMPRYYRRLARLAAIVQGVLRDEGMLVMILK